MHIIPKNWQCQLLGQELLMNWVYGLSQWVDSMDWVYVLSLWIESGDGGWDWGMEGQKFSDSDFIMFQSLRISKRVIKLKDFD